MQPASRPCIARLAAQEMSLFSKVAALRKMQSSLAGWRPDAAAGVEVKEAPARQPVPPNLILSLGPLNMALSGERALHACMHARAARQQRGVPPARPPARPALGPRPWSWSWALHRPMPACMLSGSAAAAARNPGILPLAMAHSGTTAFVPAHCTCLLGKRRGHPCSNVHEHAWVLQACVWFLRWGVPPDCDARVVWLCVCRQGAGGGAAGGGGRGSGAAAHGRGRGHAGLVAVAQHVPQERRPVAGAAFAQMVGWGPACLPPVQLPW